MAEAARNRTGDSPGDMPVRAGQQDVLRRHAGPVGDRQRRLQRFDPLQALRPQVERSRLVRHPAQRPSPAPMVTIHHGSPDGFQHLQRFGWSILDGQRFSDMGKGARPVGSQIAIIIRAGFQDHQIRPVAFAVGETPGDVAVAAGRDGRRSWQGDPGDPPLMTSFIGVEQGSPIPDVGDAQRQMHVVGQQRATVRGQLPGDRPVVAAADRFGFIGRYGRKERESRWLAHSWVRRNDIDDWLAAQVERFGTGYRRRGERFPPQRRVPLGAERIEEVGQGGWQLVVQQATGRFAWPLLILQIQIHRVHRQWRILGSPGFGSGPQQQVLE